MLKVTYTYTIIHPRKDLDRSKTELNETEHDPVVLQQERNESFERLVRRVMNEVRLVCKAAGARPTAYEVERQIVEATMRLNKAFPSGGRAITKKTPDRNKHEHWFSVELSMPR